MERTVHVTLEDLFTVTSSWGFVPSHERSTVAFLSDQSGSPQLYVMDLRTGNMHQVTNEDEPLVSHAGFEWTGDDKAIILARDQKGNERYNLFRVDIESGQVTQLTSDPAAQDYIRSAMPKSDRMAMMSNRHGQLNLYAINIQTHEIRQLTRFKAPTFAGKWSKDGHWLACGSNESSDSRNRDGYLVRADGGEIRLVFRVREGSRDHLGEWYPDGRRIAVTSDASGTYRAGILDLTSAKVTWLGHEGVEEQAGEFSPDGKYLLVTRNENASVYPVLYEVETGKQRTLNLPRGLFWIARFVLDDATLMLQYEASNRRSELVLYDLTTDTLRTMLQADYGSVNPATFVADEHVRYPSSDGEMVPAILVYPKYIEPNAKLPAVIHLHGGPTAQWYRGFDPYVQYLVNRGFVVLRPNVRGSTGYGTAWRDLNLHDWGGGDLSDAVSGAAFLKTFDFVDANRIGVYGGSYGAYLTYMAMVKHSDIFSAGISLMGITDLPTLFQEVPEQFKYYLKQQLGDPDVHAALWQERSPITYAHQLKGQLLIIHGTNDPRCPVSQARRFRTCLLTAGKSEGTDFEYHEYGDEGHGLRQNISRKINHYKLVSDFLERSLRGLGGT